MLHGYRQTTRHSESWSFLLLLHPGTIRITFERDSNTLKIRITGVGYAQKDLSKNI